MARADRRLGVGETRLHILNGQMGIRREELAQIGIVREVPEHKLDGDARSFDHWLTNQDVWVLDDAVLRA